MTINTQKFLPLSPGLKSKTISAIKPKETNISSSSIATLKSIEKTVIKIDLFLKKSLVIKKEQIKKDKVITERQKFKNAEKELEKKVKVKKFPGISLPKPKLGIFDWIKNFATNVLLGFILVRVIDHLPRLLKLVPLINSAMDFIIDWGGKLLEGLVNFIDWGYKAVDASRMFVSGIFGEEGVKKFDEFSSKFKDVVNYSLIAAMLIADVGDDIMGGSGRGKGESSIGSNRTYSGGRQRGFSENQGSTLAEQRVLSGGSRGFYFENSNRDIMKRYFQKYGRDAFIQRFGREGLESLPKSMARSGFTKVARSAFTGVLGKGGAKTVLKFIRPFTKRLPIIGALLDFGLSIALGEPIGRAAFKAIGAGVLGAIGTAAGSVIPIAGNIIGGIAGAALGDWAGGALYDLFFENKKAKPKTQNVYKHAEGGVTRGGQHIGRPRRGIKKSKISRTINIAPTPLSPGRSVGGNVKDVKLNKPKIELFYPKSTSTKEVKPYEFMEKSYKKASGTSFIGSLFGLAIKTLFGDKPTPIDYQNISSGINSWINVIINNIQTGYRGFAGGGLALTETEEQDLRNWLNIVIQNSVNPRVNQILQELMRQLLLKPMSGPSGPNPAPPGGKSQKDDPNAQFQGRADFVIGDSIAHGFAGRTGNGSDNDDSKVGRKPAEVLAILKAKGEALKGKLIDLSTGIANSSSDWAIVEEQLKYLQSMQARVRLLGVGKQWDASKGGNQVNSKLQQLANQYGAYFYGGHNASGDKTLGVHGSASDYAELKGRLAATAVSGGSLGAGDGSLRFGLTGTTYMDAPGWSHAHFENLQGGMTSQSPTESNIRKLVQDVIPALKMMAAQGLKPELARGEPILPGKDDAFYERLIRLGVSRHTHSGAKTAVDVNMPGFPKVPFALKDVRNTPQRGEGINALLANSSTTSLFHLSYKPDGTAFHGGYIRNTRENKPFTFITTHDGEYVIDKDSVDAFGFEFINLINKIENKSMLQNKIGQLMKMLDYEYEGSKTYIVEEESSEYSGSPSVSYIQLGNMSSPSGSDNSWHYAHLES